MAAAPTTEPRGLGLAQLITSITFGILTTVVVFLRTYIRVRNRVFGADDLLMVIGYILFAILVGVTAQSTFYGVGQRDTVLPEGIYPHGSISGSPKYSTAYPSSLSKPLFATPYLESQSYHGIEWLHG
ncbi:hypothetical protein H9Q70_006924 [Fusarium xylarioides]|nr:hypothetical protein H9Q70_006924 [Fusarium xylarioides]KAG5780112.1 hypothetical protein H9Q73_006257 [Fusarium xylarioides]